MAKVSELQWRLNEFPFPECFDEKILLQWVRGPIKVNQKIAILRSEILKPGK